ncbi:MAG: 16S rRNA (adenine(1518)-N(6)/adenine(1519)-N(6))-dimethyltransferase RsmA [Actinomycetota bacterium]
MSAQSLTEIRGLLRRFDLRPRPSIGQHFLADPNLVRRIVREAALAPGDRVLEVGPGTASLTLELAAAGCRVLAVEVDGRLRPLLTELLADRQVEIIFADAARLDYAAVLSSGPWKVVANLPYQIAAELILDWLRKVPAIVDMTVMVQLEVAQRLVAGPGEEAYGLPSVVVALLGEAELAFRVPPQVFYPRPAVDSAVVRIKRRSAPTAASRAIDLAAAGFGQRRKMLRSSLGRAVPNVGSVLAAAGLDARSRAEQLSPFDFLRIAEVLDGQ